MTSRRAVLAGAAALPALSLSAIASTDHHPDAELLALEPELMRHINYSGELRSKVSRLRHPVDRLRRKILKRSPNMKMIEAYDIACETPVGRAWSEASSLWSEHFDKVASPLVKQICRMKPQTLKGMAVVAVAHVFDEQDHSNYTGAWLTNKISEAAGLTLPPSVKYMIDDNLSEGGD
jgi:hypothetical protein